MPRTSSNNSGPVDWTAVTFALDRVIAADQLQNELPVLDEQGRVTGETYDRRLGAPQQQPSPERFMAHLRQLRQRYPDQFKLRQGEKVPGFDHIDPFESEGLGDSIMNMLKSGYEQSLTGLVERSIPGTDDEADLFGLIDSERMKRWQPNVVEQIGSGIASFGMPLDLIAIATGGGIAAKAPIAGKIAARAFTSAGALGTYEGARGFFEGYLDPEKDVLEEGFKGAVRGAALGAAVGGVGGVVGSRLKGAAKIAVEVPAEIFTLGTVAPLTEGRQPTQDDYIGAAGFIVGMKTIGGLRALGKRSFNRRAAAELNKLEAGEPLESLAEKAITENPDRYNNKFYKSILAEGNIGKDVGTLGDLIIGNQARELLKSKDLLDIPIKVSREVPSGESASGWVGVDKNGKFKMFVNPDHPDKLAATIGHEIGHLVRNKAGRPLTAESKDLPVAEKSAEKFARKLFETKEGRMTSRAVTVALKKSSVVETFRSRAPKSYLRFTPEGKNVKPPQKYITMALDKSRAVLGEYISKSKGKDSKIWTLLSVEPKGGQTARDVVLDAGAKAADRGQSLYIGKNLQKTRWYRALEADGKIKKVGKFRKLVGPDKTGGLTITGQRTKARTVTILPKPTKTISVPAPTAQAGLAVTPVKETTIAKRRAAFRRAPLAPSEQAQQIKSAEGLGPKAVEIVKKGYEAIKPRVMYQARNTLKTTEGQEIVGMVDRVYKTWHRLLGTSIEKVRRIGVVKRGKVEELFGKKGMTEAEGKLLADRQEAGRVPELNKIMNEFHDIIAPIFKAAGVPLGKVKNYFPRMFKVDIREKLHADIATVKAALADVRNSSDETIRRTIINKKLGIIKDTGEGLTTILEKIVSSKKARTLREAMNLLDSQLQNERGTTPIFLASGFEMRRKLGLPSSYYERDARVVLPQYFNSMSRRAAELQAWGNNGAKAIRLLEKIKAKDYDEHARADKLLRIFTGEYEREHGYTGKAKKVIDGWTMFQFITKISLGRATILNASQPLISFGMEHGIWPMMRAATRLADPKFRSHLRQSGAVDRWLLEAAIGNKPGGKFGEWTDRFGTASGFTGINKVLQYWAAATFDTKMRQLHTVANGSGRRADWAKTQLKDYDLDYRKPLSAQKDKLLEGIYRFATDSQLQANVLRDPFFLNDPRVRPFMLFKRFGLRQATYIKDVLVRETKRGNIMPIFRLAAGGFLGGEGIIWTLNKIKSMLSGEPAYRKDDTVMDRMLQNVAIIGSFGMFSDIMEIQKVSDIVPSVKFAVTPVVYSDTEKAFSALSTWLKDWENYDDIGLATERNMYSVFNFLGSYPRYASQRIKTDSQKENRQKYLKGREKSEIYQLMTDGYGDAAVARRVKWNAAYPDDKFKIGDVSTSGWLKWAKRKAQAKAAASAKKDTPEYRRIVRERMAELKKNRGR